MTKSVIARLLAVAAATVSPSGANTPELARRFEVSTKTIHRDREFLRDRLLVDLQPCRQDGKTVWHAQDRTGALALVQTLDTLTL